MGLRSGPCSRGRELAPIHIELPTSICDVRHNIGSNRESRCSTFVTADCACALGSCPSTHSLGAAPVLVALASECKALSCAPGHVQELGRSYCHPSGPQRLLKDAALHIQLGPSQR